jgi:diguanylate cyclase (GGDEF)-like protein
MRPLSDPGVVRRIAPFIATYCVGVALALFAPASSLELLPLIAAAVLTVVLSAAALGLPWERMPAWTEATPVLASFAIIALLRHAEGGANLGYAALVMLPVIWMGIYGTRAQLGFAIAASAATFVVPVILVGPPLYTHSDLRGAFLWAASGLLTGSALQSLVRESRRRAADVAALGVVTRALTTGSDPRPELCAAAQLVTDSAFAILYEQHVDGTLVATAGTKGLDLGTLQTDPTTEVSATAQVWRTGKRICIADTTTDPRASVRLSRHTGAGAVLFEPVTREGHRTAVLVIGFHESRQQVPESALYLVELLAAEIGAAIDRADLVELLATQSRSDPLTGAANRRSWDEQIRRELTRAHRTGAPLTVALLDMDHFKAYNDTHGHVDGDVLLLDLVTAIRAELRTGDVIARWGGEEFALALPDCDLAQAQTIASRLLNVVPSGQTASIGLTQAQPQDTPRALIERADRGLYIAKNSGRNQVKDYPALPAVGLVHGQGA